MLATEKKGLTFRMANLMVGGALVAALILAISHGVTKGVAWELKVVYVIALCMVALGECLSWHNAAMSWHERRLASTGLWTMLGVVLTCGTLYTNFSSTAGNNDAQASVHRAAFITQTDLGDSVQEWKKEKARLEEKLRLSPTLTVEGAQALIDKAKADPFWKRTDGCKEIKGSTSRKFCSDYASAIAAKTGASEAITYREELKDVDGKLEAARSTRAHQPVAIGDDQPSVRYLQATFKLTETSARQIDAMTVPALVQAILVLGGILLANEKHQGKPRLPWFDRARWASRYHGVRDFCTGNVERPQTAGIRVEPKDNPHHRPANDTDINAIFAMLNKDKLRAWAEKHGAQLKVA